MTPLFIQQFIVDWAGALVYNINDNFLSVSLQVKPHTKRKLMGLVWIKTNVPTLTIQFVLKEQTQWEMEMIGEALTEFTAVQQGEFYTNVYVTTDWQQPPLEHLVYLRAPED